MTANDWLKSTRPRLMFSCNPAPPANNAGRNGSVVAAFHHRRRMKKIIIVDDDSSVLTAIQRGLNAHGFSTEVFASVKAFRDSADLDQAACLVTDLNLNGDSGIDLTAQVRAMGHAFPIILVTASPDEDLRHAARDAGCDAYITKPFSLDVLIAAIESASRTDP
ncbi:MAG TPA: response regulator [Beijerinckiaceae bacterium]|jgi:DNA-binding response OmpR family regulator|nr:response regulator [Beijerinckiaceae bacterium]